ncbi:MAG: cysteine--tRNA ligase [Candidatus Methanoperedens sp.]|nr:cysteine--tRNA ligase [Candidatus Methanoperedens sp.]MCE8427395.1 cysteine--tRNA ligase [Candidatus Methanoperedens sp.]
MLKLYNSLTRKKETFRPLGDVVGIYTCGPSVYQYSHIGNFRTFAFEDVLVRYIRWKGYSVKRVMNLTDVEDKAIATAKKYGKMLGDLTEFYSKVFFEDMDTLGLMHADVFSKATEHIPEIIEIIKRNMDKGYAYCGKDGSVYYDVSKFKGWGKLSHLTLKAGKRKIKRDEWGEDSGILSDFALWKSYEKKDGNVFWETELGKGRPGWHIECSAMSTKHLGTRFDIHVGGVDNIYPHHESVIAQNFGAFGNNPSKYWLHCRHLMVEGKKMSKSAGNFFTLRDLLGKGYDPMAIKYLLLSQSYRKRLNFTFEGLEDAGRKIKNIQSTIEKLKNANGSDDAEKIALKFKKKFERVMDDNLNSGEGLRLLEELVEKVRYMNLNKRSSEKILEILLSLNSIFGLRFQ